MPSAATACPPGSIRFQFTDGGPNSNWQALGQVLADSNGCFGFIDPDGSPQRLYRPYVLSSTPVLTFVNLAKLMRKSITLLLLLSLTAGGPRLGAQVAETNSFGNLNALIPEGNPAGMINMQTVNSAITHLSSLRVSLCVAGDFNGDLYGYLRHVQGGVTNFCVLLNRVGRTASNPWGYADCGFNLLFDDAAPQGDVHIYETITNPPAGAQLTRVWQPDGRDVDPSLVLDTSPRTTRLNSFTNSNPSGEWTLFLADMSYGSTNMLASWGLLFTGPAPAADHLANPGGHRLWNGPGRRSIERHFLCSWRLHLQSTRRHGPQCRQPGPLGHF